MTTSYETKGVHSEVKHNASCISCELGKNRERHNKTHEGEDKFKYQVSVGGAGPSDLSKIKLIVISDYPGYYESQFDIATPMYDVSLDRDERKRGLLENLNAGAFLRMTLGLMYKLDTYNDVWITNAVKCNPNQIKVQDTKHIRPCSTNWLNTELHILDEYVPEVPILVAGFQAFKGVCHVYREENLEGLGANSCRRRKGLKVERHPLVVTFNPAMAARSLPKIETEARQKNGYVYPTYNEWLNPPLGSPVDKFVKDLHLLAEYLC